MNLVRVSRPETRAQQRHAVPVSACHRFHFFARHFGGQDARAGGQCHFQKRLRLILHHEPHFGERTPFVGHQRRDHRALGNRREHAAVRKARPLERQARHLAACDNETPLGMETGPVSAGKDWSP